MNPTQEEVNAQTNAQNERTLIQDIANLTAPQINREVRICLAFEDWTLESILNAVSQALIRDEALRPHFQRIIEADLDGMRRLHNLLGNIAQSERRIKGVIELITGLFFAGIFSIYFDYGEIPSALLGLAVFLLLFKKALRNLRLHKRFSALGTILLIAVVGSFVCFATIYFGFKQVSKIHKVKEALEFIHGNTTCVNEAGIDLTVKDLKAAMTNIESSVIALQDLTESKVMYVDLANLITIPVLFLLYLILELWLLR